MNTKTYAILYDAISDYKKEFKALNYWRSGDLYYFKVDRFNHKVLAIEDTINIEEL